MLPPVAGRSKPDIPGAEHAITSNEAFYLEQFPQRVVVVGGGYIAVEFAGIFNGLGAETHLLYRGDQVLRGFDEDVRNFAAAQIVHKGVRLHTHTDIRSIERHIDGSLTCSLTNGEALHCDAVMFATGPPAINRRAGAGRSRRSGARQRHHCYRSPVPHHGAWHLRPWAM